MEKMQKLNLRMQKLNFPGTHWRGLALIGAQKKPWASKQTRVSGDPLKAYMLGVTKSFVF